MRMSRGCWAFVSGDAQALCAPRNARPGADGRGEGRAVKALRQSATGASAARAAERGTRNAERGTRNAERGTRNAERGTRNAERGTRNAERGTRNAERGT